MKGPFIISRVPEEGSRGGHAPLDRSPTDHPLMHSVWQRTIAWQPGQQPSRYSAESSPGLRPKMQGGRIVDDALEPLWRLKPKIEPIGLVAAFRGDRCL